MQSLQAYSRIRDEFTFRASAPECEAIPGTLVVVHEAAAQWQAVPGLAVTLERLQVAEGGSARLTAAALKLAMTGVTTVRYSVTSGPAHGTLKVRRRAASPRPRGQVRAASHHRVLETILQGIYGNVNY